MKKKFFYDEHSFTLLKFNKWIAVYVATTIGGPRIAFYQIFIIRDDGTLTLDRYHRYKEFDRIRQEYKSMTEKQERKLLTNI
jgi:hypothetical protein